MRASLPQAVVDPAEPHFLLQWEQPAPSHWAGIGAASVAAHVVIGLAMLFLATLPPPEPPITNVEVSDVRRNATPLVFPRSLVTQRAPNRNPVSKEFNIASLPPRPSAPSVPSPGAAAPPRTAPRPVQLPATTRGGAAPNATMSEAPTIDPGVARTTSAPPPGLGSVDGIAPPARIEPQERPKLAFERPGATTGQTGVGRIPAPPKNTIDEAVRQAARGGGGGLVVGDLEGGSPNSPSVPIPGKLGSAVELVSDPMGVDFSPYLIKVLAAVRRNWFAVIPESAKLGRQGRTVIQFAIDRSGSVPKLVIAGPSGAEALDRAAVAGISASNPFPPLPAEFKGSQIRLQFVFRYNVK